ncbi:MAG: S-layer homology domain-containing protein [Ruminococcaceae bacterium]|nr:S-layer homology domain-containing protein [Oscillospiraceae bacterium]
MKKLLSLLITFTMLISLIPFSYAAESVSAVSEFSEVDFLKEIGIVADSFDGNAGMTRAEMAKLVIEAFYQDTDFNVEDGEPVFADVTSDHPCYGYIKACKDLKILNGDGLNMFHPDNNVSAIDMLTVMINALGYTVYADAYGGWPTGYYTVARETGISKGVDLNETGISNGVAAKIIYNALFADTVDLTSVSKDGIEVAINSNKNFLSDRLGIFEYDAVVVDNGYSSVYGDSVEDGERVVFEDYSTKSLITAFSNGHNVDDYLGMRVKAFIRNNMESGRYELVYIASHKRAEVIDLVADKIISFTSNYIEYDEDENSSATEKFNFEAVAPKIIYNGTVMVSVSLEDLMPEEGFVRLIDNDGNGRYDIIDITSFNYYNGSYSATSRNIVVDKVVTEEGEEYIASLFNPQASLRIDSDKAIYKFKLSGEIDSLSELKTLDVVSVAECPEKVDGKTLYYFVAERNVVSGTVSGKTENEISLSDGNTYKLSDSITDIKPSYITLIEYATCKIYLNATGNVVYTEGALKAKNFAYLVNAAERNQGEETVYVKLFTAKGTMENLQLDTTVKIDGKPCSTTTSQLETLYARSSAVSKLSGDTVTSRPVLYKTNSKGYIYEIDTDTPNYDCEGEIDKSHLNQTSIPYTEVDMMDPDTLKAGWRNPAYERMSGTYRSMNGKFFITMETVILAVPEIDTYGLEDGQKLTAMEYTRNNAFSLERTKAYELDNIDSNYKVLRANQLVSLSKYDIQGYNIDPDTGIAEFAVVRGVYESAVDEIATSTPMVVFLKKVEVYDEATQENITRIYYSNAGKTEYADVNTSECFFPYRDLIEGATTQESLFGSAVSPLRAGDIIRVLKYDDNKLMHLERVISVADNPNNLHSLILYPGVSANRYTSLAYGSSLTPYDYNNYSIYTDYSYGVLVTYVEQLKSGVAKAVVNNEYTGIVSDLLEDDKTAVKKNNPYFYLNMAGKHATVVNVSEDGESVKVEKGSPDDIRVLQEGDYKLSETSLVICDFRRFNVESIIIINGIENIK